MINKIQHWFKLAKPQPTERDVLTQVGCHFEEVAEFADALRCPAHVKLHRLAAMYKEGGFTPLTIPDNKRPEVIDALCDQIVTAIGVGYMLGVDMQSALEEVNRSNYSKFEGGKPLFDKNGKIIKGSDYTPPDLTKL